MTEIDVALTVFDAPTVLVAKDAVPVMVKVSEPILLLPYVTDTDVPASYTLFVAVIVTVKLRTVMFAVVLAVVLGV